MHVHYYVHYYSYDYSLTFYRFRRNKNKDYVACAEELKDLAHNVNYPVR